MNTALWVIWFALLVAVGFTAFEFGGFFPAGIVTRRIRQEGWDEGFDRGFPHGARANGIDPDEWLPAEPQWQYGPRWDDTLEDLMQRGRSYYEPLARPDPADEIVAELADLERRQTPIFDEMASRWPAGRTASSSTPYETSAPIGSPPVGAEPEPPAPPMVPGEMPGHGADPWQQITEANHDVWEVFDDSEVFGMIRWEIAALKRKLSEPWRLTPWKGATA